MTVKEKKTSFVKDVEKNEKAALEIPTDKYNIILILFFFLGLVHFLPFSFFTTATEFWMYKFRNTSIEETDSEFRTDLQAQFSSVLKVSLQTAEIGLLVLTLIFGHLVQVRVRKIGVLCTILTFFITLTVFVKIDTDSWQTLFFVIVMLIVAGINGANSVFTITMYTVMASFPHNYLGAYLLGVGLSNIFTAVLQILSLTLGLSIQDSALVYFLIGVLVILLTLVTLILVAKNRFYVYHMDTIREKEEERMGFAEGYRLAKKSWPSVVMGTFVLLSVDASPIALVVSEGEGNGPWNDTYFIPTITYLVAAVCLMTGRGLGLRFFPKMKNMYWCLCSFGVLVIFVPLFMLCNAQPRSHLPVLLPHDYQYIILIIGCSLSQGYLLSRAVYNIANLVTEEELKKAYHVNMLIGGVLKGLFSFVSVGSVALL